MVADEPLSDDAIVVRGGLMELPPLREAVQACWVKREFYGLSFFGDNDMTWEEIIQAAQRANRLVLGHKQVRLSDVGRLRELGCEPDRADYFPHLAVRFETSPADSELEELERVFDPPVVNPYSRG